MKQHIAKLLVFLMLMTTMIVPADLSFAESGNENTTQTEESNAPQEKPDSTQETSAKSTNDEKIVEHESSPNSSVAKESIIAAENDQLEETVTERMEFLYIESKELVAPGTQNIVVSWTEAIDDIQNMVLEYENEQGKTLTLKESKRNDESIVFTKDFTASEAGTYKIKGVQYFVGNEEKYFAFDDVEIAASFKVVKGQDIEDDAIAKVEVDSNGTVNKKEVNSEIKDAVASTDAAPKTQTKARRAKSSNIVVVLDPGHGGSDSGATRGSVYEKNINFKVAQYCKAELEQYCGVTVYMTRTGDTNPSLQERAQIAANYGANILVSIHQNSGSSSAYGAEVYYPNRNYKPAIGDSGKAVADSIQKELVSLGLSNRGTKIRNTANGSTYADGSYSDYYGIIRNSKNLGIPAIIVEHAFLSNASDYNNFLSSDSKLQKLGIADATGIAKAFGLSKSGLFYDGTGWKFLNDDKTYFQDGWKTINGKKYYFKDEYALIGWQILDGNKYYFMPDGYAITGWFSFGSIRYYANDKGVVQKGMQQISGKYYYLGEDGVMQTGWKTLNGDRYFFMPDGYAITGWFSFGSIRYYANDKGIVQKGMQRISGKYYYLGEDGVMQTGWKTLNGDRYFFMPDGYAITGWFSFGSIRYYANDKGVVQKGMQQISGKYYYLGEDGVMQTGWKTLNGDRYFFMPDGYAITGWFSFGSIRYYANDKGVVQKEMQQISGKYYYLGEDGVMQTGWKTLNGDRYFFMPDGYAITGWFSFGSIRYYANDKGIVQKGMQQISGKYYYLGEDGVMQTGWKTLNGDRYFFMPDGYAITGWFSFGSIRYYANDKGIVQKGMQQISGKYYYLGEDGVMQTGWKTLNGDRYFFMPDGYAITGWFSFGSIRYYANDKGIVQTGNVVIDGKVYRFNSDGVLIEGVEIGGQTQTTVRQMIKYYNSKGKKYPSKTYASKGATDIEAFCEIYYEESQAEGIRAEVAFCQAMKETGWLQFGGDVKVSQCNFAGIGATGGGISGASFKDVRTGVRAQIQHLKAYANTLPLNNACVDPRFKYVKRGSAPYVEWLGKNANPNGVGWAPAADYGTSIVQMIDKLLSY